MFVVSLLPWLQILIQRVLDDDHARALEEQWIDSLDTNTTASLSQSSSSSSSILQGILLGFFFPLIPFFFMREPKMPVFWESGEENEESGVSVVFS
jgi:predicted PurR-regulated permease PerM